MTEAELTDVYERLSGAVLRYCAFRLGSRHDAEDAAAEVFARLIANADRIRPDTREAWLFKVARNVCNDRHREVAREHLPSELGVEGGPDVAWVEPRVREAVARLTSGQQQVVFLRVFEDLAFSEVGRLCGRREAAVRVQYHRAISRLRKLLQEVDPCLMEAQ